MAKKEEEEEIGCFSRFLKWHYQARGHRAIMQPCAANLESGTVVP